VAAAVTDNIMSAVTTLNSSTTTISGDVPVNYAGADYGGYSETNQRNYPEYEATGSVLATTVQQNIGSGELAGSGAMVTENYVGQIITGAPNTASVASASPAVSDNTLSATFTGNASTTGLTIQAGGAPTFDGSAAVTNAQLNESDTGDNSNPAAVVKYSYIGEALVPGGGSGTATLTGSAAINGNTVSATAVGNQAVGTSGGVTTGNILTFAGGIGLAGSATDPYNGSYYRDGEPVTDSVADAIVNNTQVNYAAPLDSEVKQTGVLAGFEFVSGASVSLSNNALAAETVGNEAYNAIVVPGLGPDASGGALSAAFSVASLEANMASPITATIYEAGAGVVTGPATSSTLTVDSNAVTATATGNTVGNAISLNASSLTSISGGQASIYGDFNSVTSGGHTYTNDFQNAADVMVTSLQYNDAKSPVTATSTYPVGGILAGVEGGVTDSTLAVTNSTSAALAAGNAAGNSLALTAGALSMSAGLINGQNSAGAVTATLDGPITALVAGGATSGSTLTLDSNLQRSIATGNNADNSLTASASTIAVDDAGGPASAFKYVPSDTYPVGSDVSFGYQLKAGFVAFNDQAASGAVSASVGFDVPSLLLAVATGGLTDSAADNSLNAVVAAARGNQAATDLTLSPTASLSLTDPPSLIYSPLAVLANVQQVTNDTDVTAQITGDGTPPIFTTVNGNVSGSTVTLTANQIQALAEGNSATNNFALSGTATVTEPTGSTPGGLTIPYFSGSPSSTTVTADEAFVLSNLQFAGTGTVSAGQDGTGVAASIGGNLTGSTVMIGGSTPALGNVIASTATTNLASNTLTLAASDLQASGGLLNAQVSNGATSATVGEPGLIPSPPSGGTPGSPILGVALDGNVSGSVIGVAENQVSAESTSNAATNTVSSTSSISASSLAFTTTPLAFFSGPGSFVIAAYGGTTLADVGLLNVQNLGDSGSSTATANGSYGITNSASAPTYTGSTLSVADNTQQAIALGNEATNSLSLSPGITEPDTKSVTASLLSVQVVSSNVPDAVAASSNMMIGTPMALTDSTLNVSGNSNTASAIANDVTNALTVTGATALPGSENLQQIGYAQATYNTPAIYAYADYSLVNSQITTGGSVVATATTTLVNNDLYADPGTVSNTSVTVDGNTTLAQALGNRANNSLSVTAAGPVGVTAAVANQQINNAAIDANATIDVTYAIGQSPTATHNSTTNGSTYSITNNTTQALATGNQAVNALNVSPTAYGTVGYYTGSNVNTGGSPQISTTYAVLNSQDNTAPVTATVHGASPPLLPNTISTGAGGYVMAMYTNGAGNVVNITGNSVTAQAIGNNATNTVTLAALNTGTAATGINSVQHNTGNITAAVDNVQVGVALGKGTIGMVANNQLAASAFGNVVSNAIVTH
jgi:hypothetical protein